MKGDNLIEIKDKNYEEILKDRLNSIKYALLIILPVWISVIIGGFLSLYGILKPFDTVNGTFYFIANSFFIGITIFFLKKFKDTKLYEIAKEIHIYDDRLEFITPAGLKMVAKFEWIGLIDAVEEDLYALVFYYDENLRRCNYLYLSNDLVPHIVAQYKKWVERTGRKPCYIAVSYTHLTLPTN